MRTKVDKRRVRDPPPLPDNPVPDHHEKLDVGKHPVSVAEAQRLAAANHVVVALGPPVHVGPTKVHVDKTPAGVTEGLPMGSREDVTKGVEEKAIKKPPKKRRNDRKMETALDLSMTDSHPVLMTQPPLMGPGLFQPHVTLESTVISSVPVTLQLQQQPITPLTPSPQHQLTPPSPHQSVSHSSPHQHISLFCRSPPNPAPLLQQTPPSSSEPVVMGDIDGVGYECGSTSSIMMDDMDTVTPLVLSEHAAAAAVAVAEQIPGSELVLSDSVMDLPKCVPNEVVPSMSSSTWQSNSQDHTLDTL